MHPLFLVTPMSRELATSLHRPAFRLGGAKIRHALLCAGTGSHPAFSKGDPRWGWSIQPDRVQFGIA